MQHDLYKTWVEIDAKALRHNMAMFKKHMESGTQLIAIIKANAYGHGLAEVTSILKKEKNIWLGVDSIDEALLVKTSRAKQLIIILGFIPESRLAEALQENFHISIYSVETLEYIKNILKKSPRIKAHLHLKIETGTNRLGIQLHDLINIKTFPSIEGVYTHFADAENPKSKFYQEQLHTFRKALWILRQKNIAIPYIHTAATSAIIQYPETHHALARLGIGLYGLWPDVKIKAPKTFSLRPVLTWKTRIAQIKEIQKGETVGYDRTWRAKRKSRIAILPIGYYDGYDRRLSSVGWVVVSGKRVPVIGRICMNMFMIDVTNIRVRPHDEVVLLGRGVSADDIARTIKTINYEVVTKINPLIPRKVI